MFSDPTTVFYTTASGVHDAASSVAGIVTSGVLTVLPVDVGSEGEIACDVHWRTLSRRFKLNRGCRHYQLGSDGVMHWRTLSRRFK